MNALARALFILLILIGAVQGCGLWAAEGGASKGKRLFEEHCMVCHGQGGKGDGYRLFNPPPADLTSPAVQEKLDAALLRTIHEGRRNTAMGRWKYVLPMRRPVKCSRIFGLSLNKPEGKESSL